MYQFGCCCKAEHIEQLASIGYDYAELSAAEIASMSNAQFEETRALLNRTGLNCLAMNDYCETNPAIVGDRFSEEAIAEYAERVCFRASQLGARCIGIGAPMARRLPEGYPAALAEEQAIKFLKITGEAASKYPNLFILMEALNSTVCNFCNTQEQSLHLVQQVGMPNVRMEADFFHMAMMGEAFGTFSTYSPWTKHIHVSSKTANGVRCYFTSQDAELCSDIMIALSKAGYDGAISVEAPLNTFTDEAVSRSLLVMKSAAKAV